MNFLSHFYITPANRSAYYVFGAVLPDLVRMFHRDDRVRPMEHTYKLPLEQTVNKGVGWHLTVDKWFHKTRFFDEQVQFIKQHLRDQPFAEPPRFIYFIAHILLELILDRLLIKENQAIGRKFYTSLGKVSKEVIISYLKSQKNVNHIKGFLRAFERFQANQYVFDYQDNESFIFALNRTIERTGSNGFRATDFPLLKKSMAKIEERLYTQDFKKIFNNLEPRNYVDIT